MTTAEIILTAITTTTADIAAATDTAAIAAATAITTANAVALADALANDAAIAAATAITTANAVALAAALVEADEGNEMIDSRSIAGLATIEAGDEATAIANAFDALVNAVDNAIGRFPAWQDPDGVRAAIIAWRRLDQAIGRLRLRLAQTVTAIRVETEARLKRWIEPTPKSEVMAHALAAEAAADAAIAAIDSGKAAEEAALLCEEAAGAWGVLGDRMRTKLWLDRAKSQQWFATDFE